MYKFSRIFSKKASKSIVMLLIFAVSLSGILASSNYVFASANVTSASGGDGISLDTSSQATGSGNYTVLGNITIAESAIGEIGLGSHTFTLPPGWEFDTASAVTVNANWAGSGLFPTLLQYTPSASSFSIEFISESWQAPATLTISGLKVKPTGNLPSGPAKITHTQGTINGVVNGTGDGIVGTNFGFLKAIAGSAKKIIISNPTDTTVGNTVNVTIEVQDQFGNKVSSANDQTVTVTVDGDAKISGVTTGTGDGTYNSQSEIITSSNGQIVLTITDATAETVNMTTNHATLDHSSAQNVVFAAAPSNNNNNNNNYTNNGGSNANVIPAGISITSGGSSGEATGLIYPLPTGNNIITANKKISSTSSDGSKMENDFMTVNDNGELIQVRVQSSINPATPIKDGQIISLDTAGISEAKSISLYLPSDCLENISLSSSGYANKVFASIVAQAAANAQITAEARDGIYLFGYKRFTVGLNVKNNNLLTLEKPAQISFDVSGIAYPEELSIAWFDTADKKWVNLGGVFNNNILSANINKLGDFGIIRTLEQLRKVENLTAGKAEVLGIKVNNEQAAAETTSSLTEAEISAKGNVNTLLASVNKTRNMIAERAAYGRYVQSLAQGVKNLTADNINSYTNFITYGSESTAKLGAGERAGVLNSYKTAFGKLPVSARDWQDVINIATGRWTAERNTAAENKAKALFRTIYRREADLTNKYDDAAVNVLAYGLLPAERNLTSERTAIKTFKAIFKKNPATATEWNAVRAIAYSGATR